MLVRHLALVSESRTQRISARLLAKVGAALQKQVTRDFAPIWEIVATVSAFGDLEDVPPGYWPVILVDDVKGAAGVHLDQQGQPFALVEVGDEWTMTASHETLEMLADPFGNRLVAGQSPKPSQGRVEFLVEVCDPSEAGDFGYTVNGLRVSDFYTPRFFDPLPAAGVRYSFSGAIKAPREVLQGGYLSWHDPVSDHWFQQIFFGDRPEFKDLGPITERAASTRESVRALVDAATPEARKFVRASSTAVSASRVTARSQNDSAGRSKAASWRKQIEALKSKAST